MRSCSGSDPWNVDCVRWVSPGVPTTAPASRSDAAIVPPRAGLWLVAMFGGAAFVVVAIVLEVVGGSFANSPVPSWAQIVPLTWPPAARVVWWLAVAGAAGSFRLGLHRLGMPQRPVIVLASVVPFVVFAGGIAVGAEFSTWH